ncbi:MAG: MBL fold metallo-hydrolase [Deltaproteobacteria bacterium]|nr:MBL fold metallo-hydrolase [Deltaproteobacteria bacterium]
MKTTIRFWGVRGSIPVPGQKTGFYGGNTSCLEVTSGETTLILDAGTGLHPLGKEQAKKRQKIHLFITHCHMDHICGLPFFKPLYQRRRLYLYGPGGRGKGLHQLLNSFLAREFFPIPLDKMPASLFFRTINQRRTIPPFTIESVRLNHPGMTLGYFITLPSKKRIAYITDREPLSRFRHHTTVKNESPLIRNLQGVDLLIHDGQYLDQEYASHKGWGHSSISDLLKLARQVEAKHLVIFHHDPAHDDKILGKLEKKIQKKKQKICLAREGMTLTL